MSRNQDLTSTEVIDICAEYMSEENVKFVEKALFYAAKAHVEQNRLSGDPYIVHPVQVAGILAQLRLDPDTVATGFLHDVVEDTAISLEEIEEEFSPAVAFLVDGVTKLGMVKFQSKQEALAENHRKMLLAMAQDIRVIIVKLADRLHNMRTMKYQRKEKQVEKSKEALEIYAPLANRIGMNSIKWELEDLSLRYLNPEAYYRIVKLMNSKRDEREKYILNAVSELDKALQEVDIQAEIYGRPKHIYSIYRKMEDQNKEFDDIYDLLAIRVIVDSVRDCYGVLGAVHTKWKPMPGRFKDYIAMPKANMYQSIHTTVIGPQGRPVEIQIRTFKMHEVAEYGVAAHWAYKEGKTADQKVQSEFQKQLKWFNDLVELQDDATDASEFMDFVKEDFFTDEVYIFTPQGDVIELPQGSGPIDFAFAIHTEIGHQIIGAKANGNIIPLDHILKNGDIVEVLTNKNSTPSRDWLQFVKTSKARNRIKRYFKNIERERDTEKGRQLLEKAVRATGHTMKELTGRKNEERLLKRFNFVEMDDLFGAIGTSEITPNSILNFMEWRNEEQEESKSNEITHSKVEKQATNKAVHESGVVVEGAENLMIRLSQCCNPVPGDEILGYITRGRGISVHRIDCPNLLHEQELEDRTIAVHWAQDTDNMEFETEIRIVSFDRPGMVNELLQVISHSDNHLLSINGRATSDSEVIVNVRIEITSREALKDLMAKMRNVPDVYTVERVVQ